MYKHLIKYLYYLDIPMFIYADSDSIKILDKKDNINIVPKEIEDLELYKYLKNSNKFGIKTINNYEYGNIYYFSVINSKIDLLKETISHIKSNNIYSNITHLLWIDAGISHVCSINKNDFIKGIKYNIYPDKITLVMIKATSSTEISPLNEFLAINREKIASGLSIVPIKEIDWYSKELYNINLKTINNYNLFCLEEQLISVLTTQYPEKFEYIFSGYNFLYNLITISVKIETIINNLEYCRSNGINNIGYKILLKLLDSISYCSNISMAHNIYNILYNGQIISYYTNKNLCKKLGLFIGYLYHNKKDAKIFYEKMLENVKSNLEFVGIDLLDSLQFNEDEILQLDDKCILWGTL